MIYSGDDCSTATPIVTFVTGASDLRVYHSIMAGQYAVVEAHVNLPTTNSETFSCGLSAEATCAMPAVIFKAESGFFIDPTIYTPPTSTAINATNAGGWAPSKLAVYPWVTVAIQG
jgi:hypothetical protein